LKNIYVDLYEIFTKIINKFLSSHDLFLELLLNIPLNCLFYLKTPLYLLATIYFLYYYLHSSIFFYLNITRTITPLFNDLGPTVPVTWSLLHSRIFCVFTFSAFHFAVVRWCRCFCGTALNIFLQFY